MKRRMVVAFSVVRSIIFGLTFLSLAFAQQIISPQERNIQTPPDQDISQQVQKPKLDYMSTFLSRTTSPLGLKEDEELRRLLKQSKTHWALRAGIRHILN
ncbi:MAG: hypothetical protein PHQ25_06680 [Acidobacteriota bacterium]|nr:hypothetical protein [Acidobacteriota bacterium]